MGKDFSDFAIEEDGMVFSRISVGECERRGVPESAAILTFSAGTRSLWRIFLIDRDIATEPSQEVAAVFEGIFKRFPEAEVAEPAVTDNEEVVIVE